MARLFTFDLFVSLCGQKKDGQHLCGVALMKVTKVTEEKRLARGRGDAEGMRGEQD